MLQNEFHTPLNKYILDMAGAVVEWEIFRSDNGFWEFSASIQIEVRLHVVYFVMN